jgi:hypothetical protein
VATGVPSPEEKTSLEHTYPTWTLTRSKTRQPRLSLCGRDPNRCFCAGWCREPYKAATLDVQPLAPDRADPLLNPLEKATTDFGGIALRYGGFYGAANDALIEPVRKRQFPIVGDGGGIFSWLHLDDGAAATVAALEHSGPAIYNIVDDEPAPVRDWLPVLANALGAKPPRHVPGWLARLFAGPAAVVLGTQARGASNAKAKRELGWTPRYPSWRLGFPMTYPAIAVADGHAPDRGTA